VPFSLVTFFWAAKESDSPKATTTIKRNNPQSSKPIHLKLTHANPYTDYNPSLFQYPTYLKHPNHYHSPQSVTTVRLLIILTYPVVDNNAQRVFIVAHLINKRG
jgi:hypothetical protein